MASLSTTVGTDLTASHNIRRRSERLGRATMKTSETWAQIADKAVIKRSAPQGEDGVNNKRHRSGGVPPSKMLQDVESVSSTTQKKPIIRRIGHRRWLIKMIDGVDRDAAQALLEIEQVLKGAGNLSALSWAQSLERPPAQHMFAGRQSRRDGDDDTVVDDTVTTIDEDTESESSDEDGTTIAASEVESSDEDGTTLAVSEFESSADEEGTYDTEAARA